MAISTWIFSILAFLVGIVVLIVWVVTYQSKKGKVRVSPNPSMFENKARRRFTNGYASGEIVNEKPAKNGKVTLIEFYPFGVEHGENIPKPALQSVVVRNEYIGRYGKGEIEGKRELVIAHGMSPSDYPEKYRKTLEGKGSLAKGEIALVEGIHGQWIDNILQSLPLHMKDHAGGILSANVLKERDAMMENFKEFMLAKFLQQDPTKKD